MMLVLEDILKVICIHPLVSMDISYYISVCAKAGKLTCPVVTQKPSGQAP